MNAITRSKSALDLKIEVRAGLSSINAKDWDKLFFDHPDCAELIKLVDDAGMEGFEFESIVVTYDSRPMLVLPLVHARYPLATTFDGELKERAMKLVKFLPEILNPRVLIVGFVEGEWGQVGIDSDVPAEILARGWELAARTLQRVCKQKRAQAVAFWQFNGETLARLSNRVLKGCTLIAGQPFCEMQVKFNTIDEYLVSVDSDMRRYLKRTKRNAAEKVLVLRTHDVSTWVDQIYALYKQQVAESQMSFGQQSRRYFEQVCSKVPGAEYVLYFAEERLIGFELLIAGRGRLVSKYFAMEKQAGREFKLFFLSWLENVDYCIRHKIPTFHIGASSEKLKCQLGARLIPTAVVIKPTNFLMSMILRKLDRSLDYESAMEVPRLSLPDTM